jgi:hypothetical protein
VSWSQASSEWDAAISIDGEITRLGTFEGTARGEVDAALAYDAAARAAGRPETANFDSGPAPLPAAQPPTAPPAAAVGATAVAAAAGTDSDDDWL